MFGENTPKIWKFFQGSRKRREKSKNEKRKIKFLDKKNEVISSSFIKWKQQMKHYQITNIYITFCMNLKKRKCVHESVLKREPGTNFSTNQFIFEKKHTHWIPFWRFSFVYWIVFVGHEDIWKLTNSGWKKLEKVFMRIRKQEAGRKRVFRFIENFPFTSVTIYFECIGS